MITGGVTVLAIVNLDSASGAAIEEQAKKQGVATIDYDRLTLGGSADYYVSYDNAKVGKLQGEGLQKCLGDKPANIVYLNGSPDDNNATLFAEGAHSVARQGRAITRSRRAGRARSGTRSRPQTIFEQLYTPGRRQRPGRLRANDTLANAAIQTAQAEQPEDPRDRSGRGRGRACRTSSPVTSA